MNEWILLEKEGEGEGGRREDGGIEEDEGVHDMNLELICELKPVLTYIFVCAFSHNFFMRFRAFESCVFIYFWNAFSSPIIAFS